MNDFSVTIDGSSGGGITYNGDGNWRQRLDATLVKCTEVSNDGD
jgi:hypothetical protein